MTGRIDGQVNENTCDQADDSGTWDGEYRLTEFAERRLDEAERLLEDPDVRGFRDVDDLLRHLGLL